MPQNYKQFFLFKNKSTKVEFYAVKAPKIILTSGSADGRWWSAVTWWRRTDPWQNARVDCLRLQTVPDYLILHCVGIVQVPHFELSTFSDLREKLLIFKVWHWELAYSISLCMRPSPIIARHSPVAVLVSDSVRWTTDASHASHLGDCCPSAYSSRILYT